VAFANEQPDSYADSNGNLVGYEADEARAFFKTIGVTTLIPVLTPYSGMVPGLLADRVDVVVAAFIIKSTRCAQIAFGEPDVTLPLSMMVQKGNPLNVNTYADLAANPKAIVGTGVGEATVDLLKEAGVPASRLTLFPDQQTAFTALKEGRINVWAELEPTLAIDLKQSGDANLQVVTLTSQPLGLNGSTSVSYQAIGFRKGKDSASLVNAYNAWLAGAKTNGQLLTIISNYGLAQDAIVPSSVTTAAVCAGKS
jgi:polar amino acid transport system substrate-binding protein